MGSQHEALKAFFDDTVSARAGLAGVLSTVTAQDADARIEVAQLANPALNDVERLGLALITTSLRHRLSLVKECADGITARRTDRTLERLRAAAADQGVDDQATLLAADLQTLMSQYNEAQASASNVLAMHKCATESAVKNMS